MGLAPVRPTFGPVTGHPEIEATVPEWIGRPIPRPHPPATAGIHALRPFGPAPLRDLLIRLATADLFAARWTEEIHDEWFNNPHIPILVVYIYRY